MQQQNKIEFLAKPSRISCDSSYRTEFINTEMSLISNYVSDFKLKLSPTEFRILIPEDLDPMYNTYKITIENITEQPKPHDLLQKAANSVKIGNVKLGIEQAY